MSDLARRRCAVVTGAGQGIGEAIAGRLVRDGCRVAFADIDPARAERAAERVDRSGEHAIGGTVDVKDLGSIERCLEAVVERWGAVDIWVNNAALTISRPFLEIEIDEWDLVIATNLRGTYLGTRTAGMHMAARGFGRIINLASLAGQWGRSPTGAHYAASKAGIVALTRYAAMEFAHRGVTVNAIAPAAIEGPSLAAVSAQKIEAYSRQIPVGRLGRRDEVAGLAVFLASDDAGFVTGATYDVNGGLLMR